MSRPFRLNTATLDPEDEDERSPQVPVATAEQIARREAAIREAVQRHAAARAVVMAFDGFFRALQSHVATAPQKVGRSGVTGAAHSW